MSNDLQINQHRALLKSNIQNITLSLTTQKLIRMARCFSISFFIIFLLINFSLHAEELSALYVTLNQKQSNNTSLKDAIKKGQERALFCKYCHGVTGNSKRGYIPNLAAQNPKYLLHQFELFASKKRKDKIMSELIGNLSSDERINIALYYSNQKVARHSNSANIQDIKGRNIFQERCIACHAKNGHGQEILPRIAGQPMSYLTKTLQRYRSNTHNRPDSPMQTIAANLNNDDLKSVVRYISTMQ